MDRIYIRDLAVQCIIGTRPEERQKKQAVIIDIALECDLVKAGSSDRLEDTVNYNDLTNEVVSCVEASCFFLLERLADAIAGICLKADGVKAVTVTIDKPGALPHAKSAAVEIRRKNG